MKDFKKQFITTFVIGAVLLTGITVLVNMVFNNIDLGRFDLTADQVYKISPSVKKVLSELEAPIEITYYVSSSEKMPTQWKNLERDVIDKLDELKLASNGMLTYTVFDPSVEEEKEAFEETKKADDEKSGETPKITRKKIAERLMEKGVIPFGVQSTERDEFAIKRVYSSLVLSYLDRKEDVIEEVRPESFGNLEYEVMSRIFKLISNKRPKIGFYPSQPEIPAQYRQYYRQAPPDMYEQAVKILQEAGYDVTRTNIKKDDPVPEGIQTMLVMVDQPLEDRQLYEIDKLVHKGVRVIMAAQQNNYQIMGSRVPGEFDVRGQASRLNINSLTQNYGFEFDDQQFMDASTAYIQVPVSQNINMGGFQIRGQRLEPVTEPVIIKVNAENINQKVSISNKISELFYLYGGRLILNDVVLDSSNIDSRVLFTSSNKSWVREGNPYGMVDVSAPSPEEMLKEQPLAVLLEGSFDSQYLNRNIPQWQPDPEAEDAAQETEPDQPSEISGPGKENKLIAFGCSNLFKSDVLQSAPSHVALLRNCVDALTLGDELINIRSKNIAARRIHETSTVGKAMTKLFVVWFPPVVFVVLGIFVNIRRKMK